MAVMWVLRKPTGFNLPNSYQRILIQSSVEFSGDNYSFIKPLNESSDFQVFLIGQYLETRDTKQYPEDDDLIQRDFSYPTVYTFKIYISDSLIFCMGSNLEIIKDILTKHSGIERFSINTIDLDKIETGFSRGLIGVSGQRYKSEQGTLIKMIKKVEPISFDYDETSFETGEDIDREYLEILVTVGEIVKRFNIYPNGKIAYKGKFEQEQSPFVIMKRVYDKIMDIISSVENVK